MRRTMYILPVAPICTALWLAGFGAQVAQESASGTRQATVLVERTEDLQRALDAARPGDEIVIAPGDYRGVHVANVSGSAERPIVVRGQRADAPPTFVGGLHLSDVSHLRLERFAVRGTATNGINIDDGGTFDSPSHHIALVHVTVVDTGGAGNVDGIKLSGVQDFTIEGCTVERWGRGGSAIDMVGCQRGRIERCTIRDRADGAAANGIQAKGGSRDITIRRCRFEDAGQRAVNIGGSTALAYFRPKPEGFEAQHVLVERCTFVGSLAPIAFVGADGAEVRFNTFYRPGKWFLRILQETRGPEFVPCRNGVFANNLVAYRRREIATPVNVGPGTSPESFRFERNYWWAMDDPAAGLPALPTSERDGVRGADPLFADPAANDLRVRPESPARGYGADA